MPERVVDGFEIVKVELHQRQSLARALGFLQQGGQIFAELAPVRQSGQRIMGRQMQKRCAFVVNSFLGSDDGKQVADPVYRQAVCAGGAEIARYAQRLGIIIQRTESERNC